MSKNNKNIHVRRNVQEFVDYDYRDKLSDEEKQWLDKFTDEAYCNSHGKPGSIHRTELGDKYDKELTEETNSYGKNMTRKQAMYRDTNIKNSDIYGISNCAGMLDNIDDKYDLYDDSTDTITDKLKLMDPDEAMEDLIDDTVDLIDNSDKPVRDIVANLARKSVELFIESKKMK